MCICVSHWGDLLLLQSFESNDEETENEPKDSVFSWKRVGVISIAFMFV